MKTYCYVITVITFFAILLSTLYVSPTEAQDNSSNVNTLKQTGAYPDFNCLVKDFGKVYEGKKITIYFPFVNSGSEQLRIYNCKSSCGCTVAKYNEIIGPGQKGNIIITFDTKNRSGKQQKSIRISTNCYSKKEVVLTVKGNVIPLIYIKPQSLHFVSVTPTRNNQRSVKINLNPNFKQELKITKVKTSSDVIKYKLTKLRSGSYDITITIDYDEALKEVKVYNKRMKEYYTDYTSSREPVFNGYLLLNTNIKEKPTIRIYYSGTLKVK